MKTMIFKNIIIAILVCITINCSAQEIITSGVISYEHKVNNHKMLSAKDDNSPWKEMMLKQSPKYTITNYELYFNDSVSNFKKSKVQPPRDNIRRNGWMGGDDENNYVLQNFTNNTITSLQAVMETNSIVKDSLPQYTWQLHNEFKQIAGYNCRKASTTVFDSVYVIAYYTDAITLSSGPKKMCGLPGMILCVHIPRTFTTYIATKIETTAPTVEQLIPKPTKGKQYTTGEILKQLSTSTESWGKEWKEKSMWGIIL